jgi:hypothetical protein
LGEGGNPSPSYYCGGLARRCSERRDDDTEENTEIDGSLGSFASNCSLSAGETPALKTQKDKVSYGIGVDAARNLKRQGIEVDVDILVKGLRDELSGEKLLMTEDDFREVNNYDEEDTEI